MHNQPAGFPHSAKPFDRLFGDKNLMMVKLKAQVKQQS
jgi:hypothetical protein